MRAAEQNRPDVAHERRRWHGWQRVTDPARFVFLDETATTTDMARRYGRSLLGARLVAAAPAGHWKTTTFIAGLRESGVIAPLILDGAMNDPASRTGGRAGRCAPGRQHHRQGAPLGGRRKRGAQAQAIGRSRGGRTTKIHAVVDGRGRPFTFTLSAGQRGDAPLAPVLIESLPAARLCIADTAYDSDAFRHLLIARGTLPVIPNNPTRKHRHPFDPVAHRLRNLIERAFCRLKDWRRIATRYDKLASNYAAAICIAIVTTWWI